MEGSALSTQLLELQQLDRRHARLARRQAVLLRAQERNRIQNEAVQQRSRDQLREMRSAQELLSDLAWELEDLELRLRELQAQQPGSGDVLLDREVGSLRQRHDELERRVLELMLQTDELTRQMPARRAELARRASRHARQEQWLRKLLARLNRRIKGGERRRAEIAALVPPALLTHYESLRAATQNQPLAQVISDHCSVCGSPVGEPPPSPFSELFACPRCGRLLIYL